MRRQDYHLTQALSLASTGEWCLRGVTGCLGRCPPSPDLKALYRRAQELDALVEGFSRDLLAALPDEFSADGSIEHAETGDDAAVDVESRK